MNLMDKYYDRDEVELTKAEDIVFSIIAELNGRKGVGISDVDSDIQEEILETLIDIVDEKL